MTALLELLDWFLWHVGLLGVGVVIAWVLYRIVKRFGSPHG